MTIIAETDRAAVRDLLANHLESAVELLFFTENRSACSEMAGVERTSCDETAELLSDLASLSDRVQLTSHDVVTDPLSATTYNVSAVPTVLIRRLENPDNAEREPSNLGDRSPEERRTGPTIPPGEGVRFVGQPGGYEFTTLLSDIVDVSKGESGLPPAILAAVHAVDRPVHIQVFVTPACPSCPRAARLAHQMAMANPRITADVIEVNEFPELSERYQVRSVPKTVINNRVQFDGMISEAKFLEALERAASDDA